MGNSAGLRALAIPHEVAGTMRDEPNAYPGTAIGYSHRVVLRSEIWSIPCELQPRVILCLRPALADSYSINEVFN